MYQVELLIDDRRIIGEGPIWDKETGCLYYIDIMEKKIFRWDGVRAKCVCGFDETLGFAVLRRRGGFLVGLASGFYLTDAAGDHREFILDPEPDRADGRLNDGKVDPKGRLYAGTMPVSLDSGYGEAGEDSALYCLDEHYRIHTMLTGVVQGNGMGWSASGGHFYFIDTQKHCVYRFVHDAEKNTISDPQICVTVPPEEGIPDGMTTDEEGMLWVAHWGGGCVCRYHPETGEKLEEILLPAPHVTSCCFGGPEMNELFITTASVGTNLTAYPHAGGVFHVKTGVRGAESYPYAG